MWELLFKIWFAVVILPWLILSEGHEKLKAFLWRRYGIKWDWYKMTLVLLLILLVILLLNGFRW